MVARIINCSDLSDCLRAKAAKQVELMLDRENRRPSLVALIVGDHPASHIYVRNKINACKIAGIKSTMKHYHEDIPEKVLLKKIELLNQDSSVHGILVQVPLPRHIDSYRVTQSIFPRKDVDGFNVLNSGLLMAAKPLFKPCTPYGIIKILDYERIPLKGTNVVIVGSSNIVGKPMAMLLLNAGATVTVCNSNTKELEKKTRKADVLISATGIPKLIDGSMIKTGATVIDVGINRDKEGKLCGDIDFDSAREVARAITPVPGGVGLITVSMLLMNTVKAAKLGSNYITDSFFYKRNRDDD